MFSLQQTELYKTSEPAVSCWSANMKKKTRWCVLCQIQAKVKTRLMWNLQGTNSVVSESPLTPSVLSVTLIGGMKCLYDVMFTEKLWSHSKLFRLASTMRNTRSLRVYDVLRRLSLTYMYRVSMSITGTQCNFVFFVLFFFALSSYNRKKEKAKSGKSKLISTFKV